MGRAPLLEASNLVKRYNGRAVVDHLSFEVGVGEIVGLLGRNGAGKTTSFRMTVGMIDPEGGTVIFEGEDVTRLPMYRRAQRGMGYLSQNSSVFQRLTVRQNLMAILETMRDLSKRQRRQRAQDLIDQFGLSGQVDQEARTLSGGERRKLEIARALVTEPSLLMLDEPFSGVDPIAVEELQTEILRLRKDEGIAILLTDHNVRETLEVTDRSYIIDQGRELRSGTPAELVRDPVVRRTYLGSTFSGDEFDDSATAPAAANTPSAPAATTKATVQSGANSAATTEWKPAGADVAKPDAPERAEPTATSKELSPPTKNVGPPAAELLKAVDTADLQPPDVAAERTEAVAPSTTNASNSGPVDPTTQKPVDKADRPKIEAADKKQLDHAKPESSGATGNAKKTGDENAPRKKTKRSTSRGKKKKPSP